MKVSFLFMFAVSCLTASSAGKTVSAGVGCVTVLCGPPKPHQEARKDLGMVLFTASVVLFTKKMFSPAHKVRNGEVTHFKTVEQPTCVFRLLHKSLLQPAF